MLRSAALALLGAGLIVGQGLPSRAQPSDYPVHSSLGALTIAAEYQVHGVAVRGHNFIAGDYLVVEVGCYPARGEVAIATAQFTLRLNGKRTLLAQAPSMVGASIKYAGWERRPTFVGYGRSGDAGVIVGRPRTVERFPGDPRPGQERLPAPPQAPAPDHERSAGIEPRERPDHELVVEAALPERATTLPVSGYLYFPYQGKTKSLKTVELVYQGSAGQATLRLK